ncbi:PLASMODESMATA CALLOSE-BINDING PROTEIN 3-like isoform X2 [Benincasa hispida]|uniref:PLASMODESMATA CALLOSE-BINDING PROTEIN 3-like isoform X2 n=1 Tax=Benincasa hispida TaxID=102211 RepID=UPI00190252F2|nr:PLASMODESMATA CALLOSE-BINDING PROTEIN 3-like isoform X2 [Benincasa hispida]
MDGRFICSTLILFLFIHCFSPGSSRTDPTQKQGQQFRKSSSNQKDITTPITTVPTVNIPTMPIINPTSSNPDTVSPAMTTPSFTPATTTASGGSSWCIASVSASQAALQLALDYACGMGGADCSSIQAGGNCYNPNSVRDHASYAFNSYYQKNPLPNSCNFGGTAMITSTNPSSGTCEYPSTSTSSSVLNTTNSSGSTVFGAVPSGPSTSSAAALEFPSSQYYSSSFLFFTNLFLLIIAF